MTASIKLLPKTATLSITNTTNVEQSHIYEMVREHDDIFAKWIKRPDGETEIRLTFTTRNMAHRWYGIILSRLKKLNDYISKVGVPAE